MRDIRLVIFATHTNTFDVGRRIIGRRNIGFGIRVFGDTFCMSGRR